MDSPLLFPVKRHENKILVLDETALPFKEAYIEVDCLEDALKVLNEMKTRSLGQVLLFFHCCVFFRKEHRIEEICKQFQAQRPTFDFKMLQDILLQQVGGGITVGDAVDGFIRMFDKARKRRTEILADMLPDPANILTICNVNGELIYLYEELVKLKKTGQFFVSETRPYLQGSRLTFWELSRSNIPVRIIVDNQAAVLMTKGAVNCVVTGADRATVKGDIINKIGTYALARLALHFNIPFYPLIQYPRDIDIDSIPIEERPDRETFMFLEGNFSSVEAFYPAFDLVHSEYVTKSIALPVYGKRGNRG